MSVQLSLARSAWKAVQSEAGENVSRYACPAEVASACDNFTGGTTVMTGLGQKRRFEGRPVTSGLPR
jgi:hypothetical protein